MNIGPAYINYYSQYYPYVGASPQVISGYDNGNYTFIAYGYFNNTFDGWKGYPWLPYFSPTATSNGIEMLNDGSTEGTYILPPNNGNIPKIPLIVEEAWYYGGGNPNADANVIALVNPIYIYIITFELAEIPLGKFIHQTSQYVPFKFSCPSYHEYIFGALL